MTEPQSVTIYYHYDDGSWWADSPDLAGFTAVGETFNDVRQEVFEGVRFFCDSPVAIVEAGVPNPHAGEGDDVERVTGGQARDAHLVAG